jgi:DNA transformation protein
MSVSADYLAYVVDQLSHSTKVTSRRMFGCFGLYGDNLFFGLIDDDVLYLKVDDSNRMDYTSRGCAAFQPLPDPNVQSMNYFSVPPEVLEDADELRLWARKSIAVAALAAAAKSPAAVRNIKRKKPLKKPAAKARRAR